jgi:competence protein ComEA
MLLTRRIPMGLLFGIVILSVSLLLPGVGNCAPAKAPLVDLNTASLQELDALKGIGPTGAKKIIEARPYASVDDLSKAGLSAKQIEALKPLVTVSPAKGTAPPAASTPAKPAKAAETSKLIDLNNASRNELESLPGIGKISADKIIAGRPYDSVNDLKKAGIPEKNISVLKPLVTVTPVKKSPVAEEAAKKPGGPAALVDLNKASQTELEALPEVGKATARKIIASRPFASVDDLAKAGLSAKKIAELKPLVTVTATQPTAAPAKPAAAPAAAPATAPAAAPATAPPAAPTAAPATAPAAAPATAPAKAEAPAKAVAPALKLAPGQKVNINTASKEMLDALPEIGPVKAQAIIDNRPYKKIEDIMKVKGIKEGTFSKIKDQITVD